MFTPTLHSSELYAQRRFAHVRREAEIQGFNCQDFMNSLKNNPRGNGSDVLTANQSMQTLEWVNIDEMNYVEVMEDELKIAMSLKDREITHDSYKEEYRWPVTSDSSDDVTVSLNGQDRPKLDSTDINYDAVDVPYQIGGYSIPWNVRAAEVANGSNIIMNTAQRRAIRHVLEQVDNTILVGNEKIQTGTRVLKGLLNRNSGAGSDNVAKGANPAINGADGPAVEKIVKSIKAKIRARHRKDSRYTLFMNSDDLDYCEDTEYSTQYPNKSIGQRIRELGGIDEVIGVNNSNLGADKALMIVKDDIQLVSRTALAVVPLLRTHVMEDHKYEVIASCCVAMKTDINGNIGIARYNVT